MQLELELNWAIIKVKSFIQRNVFEIACVFGIIGLLIIALIGEMK